MIEPFLIYDNIRLLNIPGVECTYDEVLVQDCYRRHQVPEGSIVMDVGGFCGEFGVWCAATRNCCVRIFEPSLFWDIARFNCLLNAVNAHVVRAAIGETTGIRVFHYRPDHPAGSHLDHIGADQPCVQTQITRTSKVMCLTLGKQIELARNDCGLERPVVCKFDCEGAEREIFKDESWLDKVQMVMMEWHFKDSPRYIEVLQRHGFHLDTNESNPEAWSGIIYASKL